MSSQWTNRNAWHIFFASVTFSVCALGIRCQSPKYETGFKGVIHLWHLASGWAMNTSDENL